MLKSINKSQDNSSVFLVLLATFLGGVVRLYPVLLSQFPLNDGGLFLQMTRDLLNNHFSLPAYVSYNGNVIPFGYPPLAFYLMAFFHHVFNIDIITQLRLLPALISTLTIPAFYFLSKSITGSKVISVFASFAYALMPTAYYWLIMGGGVTRSLGVLFCILSLIFLREIFREPKISALLLSILFCSLTILSHPGISWFLFLTSLLIGLCFGLYKKGILFAIFTIFGILLMTFPWWLLILQRFGFSLLINALRTGDNFNPTFFVFYFTGELFSSILAFVALLGLFGEIVRRKFFLLLWLVIISIFSARMGHMLSTIPVAMLFGSGFVWVVIPGLLSNTGKAPADVQTLDDFLKEKISKIAFGVILILAFFSALALPLIRSTQTMAVSQYDQQAMDWVSDNTPVDSKFIVLTGSDNWPTDYISEWFPALTNRTSVTTVQGSEWLSDYQFRDQIKIYDQIQSCADKDYACILLSEKDNAGLFSYLYLRKFKVGYTDTGLPLAYYQTPLDHFQLVYENPEVRIYRIIDQP